MSKPAKTDVSSKAGANILTSAVFSAQRFWPLAAALILGIGLTISSLPWGKNAPAFAYPLDDTYISLAMSKNLVEHGTGGVNPGLFAPAASSPLWILIQAAAMKMAGVHLWIALFLSSCCAIGLLTMVDAVGRREGWPDYFRAIILILLVVITPLVSLTILGMEHVLHIILTLWTLYILWRLPEHGRPDRGASLCLLVAIALTTATRFEGLFLAMAVAFILVLRRHFMLAAGAAGAAFVPVAIHAAFSILHGWSWLPSSVMLKGNMPVHGDPLATIQAIFQSISDKYLFDHRLACAFTLPLVLLAILPRQRLEKRVLSVSGIFLLMFLQHLGFAKIGWFFRYEAYLLATQIFIAALMVGPMLPQTSSGFMVRLRDMPALVRVSLALLLLLPQVSYACNALTMVPIAMKNISDQQCQMAAFLTRYYRGSSVALNDIGAVSYSGSVHITDLFGLANRALFKAKVGGCYTTKAIGQVCDAEHCQIAMVYDGWFVNPAGLPASWIRVGSLKIEDNFICGSDTVSFYALNLEAAEKLQANLQNFTAFAPPDAHVSCFRIPAKTH